MRGRLGLGCGALGTVAEREGQALVARALELGVAVFDTARSYDESEARLGRWLEGTTATRSTKGGYGVEPVPEWTADAITAGIERARRVLRVDRVDVFFLHSCPLEVLRRPGLVEALLEARARGFIAAAGYSGDGEALSWAAGAGVFDAVQASFSVFDQANGSVLRRARAAGLRVFAKRPVGGGVWSRPPADDAARTYRHRFETMELVVPIPWDELAIRFVTHAPEVDVALLGTTSPEHLERATSLAAKGPLPEALDRLVRDRFAASGPWPAMT